MLRAFSSIAIVVSLLVPAVASAQARERAAARAGLEAYNKGEYETALKKFQEAEAGASNLQNSEQILVRRYLGYCLVAFGRRDEAKAQFKKVLALDSTIELDPTLVSPKILATFEEAKKEMGGIVAAATPTPPVVVKATPAPTPTAVAMVTATPPSATPTPMAKPTPTPGGKARGRSSFALGGRAGAVLGDSVSPSVALASRFRPLKSGALGRLSIGAEVGFYAVSRTVDAAEESIGVYERDYALTVLPIDLLVEFEQPLGPIAVFGAFGGGAAMVSGAFEGKNPYGTVVPSTAVSATSPGIHAFGGVRRPLGPGSLELAIGVRRTTPLVAPEATVRVPLGGATVGLGYLYSF